MKKCNSRFCNGLKGSAHGLGGFVFFGALFLFFSLVFSSCNQPKDIEKEIENNQEVQLTLVQKLEKLEKQIISEGKSEDEKACLYAKFFSEATGLELDHTYIGQYDKFSVGSNGNIKCWSGSELAEQDLQGTIKGIIIPEGYSGLIAVIKTERHTNWGHCQYPDYNEENEGSIDSASGMSCYTHHGCYVPFYVKPEGDGFYMAQGIWTGVEGSNGNFTACAKTLDQILYLFDTYGYDRTCANLYSSYSRNCSSFSIPRGILRGVFNY